MTSEISNSLIDIGKLSKPATVLVEKVSDAIGGFCKPWQIQRIAKAEVAADIIRAKGNVEISEIQQRAVKRFVDEETRKQINMENISLKALPLVDDESTPEDVENDWITYFFEKCRLISDEKMQQLWAGVLSGEANSPGTFSKRSIDILSSFSQQDAFLFSSLCNFEWLIDDQRIPIVFDLKDRIYHDQNINYENLMHLSNIGLIEFTGISTHALDELPTTTTLTYHKTDKVIIKFLNNKETIDTGFVLYSKKWQRTIKTMHATTD